MSIEKARSVYYIQYISISNIVNNNVNFKIFCHALICRYMTVSATASKYSSAKVIKPEVNKNQAK